MFITKFRISTLMLAVATCGVSFANSVDASSLCALAPAATIGSFESTDSAGSPSSVPAAEFRVSDPVGPFPLSAIVPFSWTTIEGIWTMKLPDKTPVNFSFAVQPTCDGRKIVQVTGFDEQSYRVTADGVGLVLANDTMVRAVMTSMTSQYMVFIRQFRMPPPKTGRPGAAKPASKIATVVTLRPFSGSEADDVHMVARKTSALKLDQYLSKQRADQSRR